MKNIFKKIFYILLILVFGCIITSFLTYFKFGIQLPFGWIGWYLENPRGFPFSFTSPCPTTDYLVVDGCLKGLNITALIFDIIFNSLLFHYIIKTIKHFFKKFKKF